MILSRLPSGSKAGIQTQEVWFQKLHSLPLEILTK